MCQLCETRTHRQTNGRKRKNLKTNLKKNKYGKSSPPPLSIQPDLHAKSYLGMATNAVQGISPLLGISRVLLDLATTSHATHSILESLLPESMNYLRVDPLISFIEMDETDPQRLSWMREETLQHMTEDRKLLEQLAFTCAKLLVTTRL